MTWTDSFLVLIFLEIWLAYRMLVTPIEYTKGNLAATVWSMGGKAFLAI